MATRPTRRDFLTTTAAGAASASAVWHAVGPAPAYARQATADSPMQRINFASIGVDGKGSSDSKDAADKAHTVALCDVDDRKLRKSKARLSQFAPDAKTFADFREMFSEMGEEIQAVTVSTPDHTHAAASVMAMALGKHCFCQKPLTWSMREARVMRELAAEKGVCTQMGNQGTATDGLREGVEVIRSGALGEIKEVHVWTNRPVWAQGDGLPKVNGAVKTNEVPPYLSWDLWLGPAPFRPFTENIYHPFQWRGWLDFGTGALGDMACHTANMVVMALALFDADTAVAEHSGIVEGQYPGNSRITFQFAEREGDGREYGPVDAAVLVRRRQQAGPGAADGREDGQQRLVGGGHGGQPLQPERLRRPIHADLQDAGQVQGLQAAGADPAAQPGALPGVRGGDPGRQAGAGAVELRLRPPA